MAAHEAVKEKDEKKLKKYWLKGVQLPAKFKKNRHAFFEMLEEFKSLWNGYLGRIYESNHRIDLLNDNVRPVHSAPNLAGPTERQFAAANINQMLAKKVIESATTEWAAPILFATKKHGSLRFCVGYRKLDAVTISDLYLLPLMTHV